MMHLEVDNVVQLSDPALGQEGDQLAPHKEVGLINKKKSYDIYSR